MNNWKTTVCGALAAVLYTLQKMDLGTLNAKDIGLAVVLALVGYFAKDHDNHGPDAAPDGKQVLTGRASLLLLCALLPLSVGCQALRDKWNGLSPQTQANLEAAAKDAARIALNIGLSQLGDSVKELRPYTEQLKPLFQATFAQPVTDPGKLGDAIKAHVAAVVPAESQPRVAAALKEALRDKATSSAPGHTAYRTALAARL